MHFLCPLCDPLAYVEKIKTINTNFINQPIQYDSQLFEIILNPIISVYQDNNIFQQDDEFLTKLEIIKAYQQEFYTKKNYQLDIYKNIDLFYGFDFFIQACDNENQQSAFQHIQLFNSINQFINNIFTRKQLQQDIEITSTQINKVYLYFFGTIKQFEYKENIEKEEKKILIFAQEQFKYIIKRLQKIQNNCLFYKNSILTLKEIDKLIETQIQFACIIKTNEFDAIFEDICWKLLRDNIYIQIGGIIFNQIKYVQSLWQKYFQSLNNDQKLLHVESIRLIFTKDLQTNQEKCQFNKDYLEPLIYFGKALKKEQQYFLSLINISQVRLALIQLKIINPPKLLQPSILEDSKMCFIIITFYKQIAKLCIYCHYFNSALEHYQILIDLITQIYEVYQDNDKLIKLLDKLYIRIITMLFYSKNYNYEKRKKRILELCYKQQKLQQIQQQNQFSDAFVKYILYIIETNDKQKQKKFELQLKNVFKFQKCLQDIINENLPEMLIPQNINKVVKYTNLIEYEQEDKQIKKEPEHYDMYFNCIIWFLIVTSNINHNNCKEYDNILNMFLSQLNNQFQEKISNLIQNNVEYKNNEIFQRYINYQEQFQLDVSRTCSYFSDNLGGSYIKVDRLIELVHYFNDPQLTELINLISLESQQFYTIQFDKFIQDYQYIETIYPNIMKYINKNNEYIIVKKREVVASQVNFTELKQQFESILCQFFINNLNEQNYCKLIHFDYKIEISNNNVLPHKITFHFIYPQYQKLTNLNIEQFKMIVMSINRLNRLRFYHRDLKPQNIMLFNGNPIIIDFESAQFYEPTLNRFIGGHGYTENYYPIDDQLYDKVDIYALGIMFKELVNDHNQEFVEQSTLEYMRRPSLDQLLQLL